MINENLFQPVSVPNSWTEGNWLLDSPKLSIRLDDAEHGSVTGTNATVVNNVAWNTGGFEIKGDYHNVTGNLALKTMNLFPRVPLVYPFSTSTLLILRFKMLILKLRGMLHGWLMEG